jgi:excisionase family DNA binding protein
MVVFQVAKSTKSTIIARMVELLTTADAARIAGVGTTSVKRWADEGMLPCTRTAGGHRRFSRTNLSAFLAKQRGPVDELGAPVYWCAQWMESDVLTIQGALLQARARLGNWTAVASELALGVTHLGLLWQRGHITIVQEHLASARLSRALARISESLPDSPNAPRCILACAEGDTHMLGLSLVELCLRACSWKTMWTGQRTPITELKRLVEAGEIEMIGLSASAFSVDAAALRAQLSELEPGCRDQNIPLLIGGQGAWPESPDWATRVQSFEVLEHVAKEHWSPR